MWTTDLHKYGLVEVRSTDSSRWILFDIEVKPPLVIDDEAELLKQLVERMKQAGVRRLNPEDISPK